MLLQIVSTSLGASESDLPTLYLIGDSTMADKPMAESLPERGWGQLLKKYFGAGIVVSNHAMNGRSSKSFIDEGRWARIHDQLKPGDWVIIQFGHNDQKDEDPLRYTAPDGAYRENLICFIKETRVKGAFPILATPVCRRRFNDRGDFYDTHGAYPEVVRSIAQEESVPLLELHAATAKLIAAHGPERSKAIFLWIEPGVYPALPEGLQDDTHFSNYGAEQICQQAIAELRRLELPITQWLKDR
jgi:lysophospholipase L1-like esterase